MGYRVLIQSGEIFAVPFADWCKNASQTQPTDVNISLVNLIKAMCTSDLPDMELMVHLGDGPAGGLEEPPLPFMSWVGSVASSDIVIPYWSLVWHGDEQPTPPDWDAKIPKAFWRGSTTDGHWNVNNWATKPRFALIKACAEIPELCDASFTKYLQVGDTCTS